MYGESVTMVQLHYVRAASDLGSFSRAAVSLGVTQPALSNGVATLERALGGAIFVRSATGVTLTPLGDRVLPHLHRILASIETVLAEVRADNGREVTPLRVGVSPLIHPGVIARALEGAGRNRLGPLVLTEDNMSSLRDLLRGRQVDLILVPAVAGADQFAHQSIEAEPLHYLTASDANDLQSRSTPIELSELSGRPLVMIGDTCGLTAFTSALFTQSGHELRRYAGEADSYRTLEEWAALGLGGALLPRSKFGLESGARPLVRDGVPVILDYEALWLPNSARLEFITALLDAMLA